MEILFVQENQRKKSKLMVKPGKKRISLLQAGMKKLLQVTSIQRCFRKKKYILYIYIPSTKTHLDSDETKTLVDDLKKHIGSYHPVL